MISIAGMSSSVALQLVNATEDKDQELIRNEPQHAREIAYFLDNIGDVENVEHTTPSGHRGLGFIDCLTKHLDRLDEQLYEKEKRHDGADGGRPIHREHRSHNKDRRDHQRREELANSRERRRQCPGPDC